MKIIQDNPYRIAGIIANASAREVAQQKAKLTRYASIGKQVVSEYDFPFLSKVDRSENAINKAFAGIEQAQDKVRQSLFWFIVANAFDETAIKYLINGDKEKSIDIWEKVTIDKEVNAKNYSCLSNLGTMKLLGDSDGEISKGIEAKIKLIESSSFVDFVQAVADQTYTVDSQKQVEKFVDDLLNQFKEKYSIEHILNLFTKCNGTSKRYLTLKLSEEPRHNIETQIENTKSKRKSDKRDANKFGFQLYDNCKDDLAIIKTIHGELDLKFTMIADNLAKEILKCGIDYFKEWQNSKDPSDEAIKLLKFAKSIAVGLQVLDRIDSNIQGMTEFKENYYNKEINQAIVLLRSIKDAFDANEKKIRAEVEYQKMFLTYGQTINWDKVHNLIKNSLDWNKVVELIIEVIPKESIEKIINHHNKALIKEYKDLVEFLFEKIDNNRRIELQYLRFWNGGSCYIATMVYGNYDHPQVLELRMFRDNVLSKSKLGCYFIKIYYSCSPFVVEKLNDKPMINMIIRNVLDNLIKLIKTI